MVGYNKFQDFVEQLGLLVHDLSAHTLKVALVRSTDGPLATDTILGNMAQPTGTGYAPIDVQNTWAEGSGTATLTGTKCIFTATAGDWLSFRYVVLYNDDDAGGPDKVIGWWDYTSDVNLGNGETFTIKFNGSETTGTIFTLA